jgi:hypothetical protein
MENVVSSATVLWLAFAAAFVFGAIGQKTHFCTMGAVSDIVNMGDWSRMRMWLLAIGVAILGAGAACERPDRPRQVHLPHADFHLAVLPAGRCLFRHRHGAGLRLRLEDADPHRRRQPQVAGGLRHPGLVAYMTMRGVFGVFRVNVLEKAAITFPAGRISRPCWRQPASTRSWPSGWRFSASAAA